MSKCVIACGNLGCVLLPDVSYQPFVRTRLVVCCLWATQSYYLLLEDITIPLSIYIIVQIGTIPKEEMSSPMRLDTPLNGVESSFRNFPKENRLEML